MSFTFRYPNITGRTDREQIEQIVRYLRQLVDQLRYAPFAADNSGTENDAQSLEALRKRLTEDVERLTSRIEQMSKPVVGEDYFTENDKQEIINAVLAALKEE